jgi:hypothetical protein
MVAPLFLAQLLYIAPLARKQREIPAEAFSPLLPFPDSPVLFRFLPVLLCLLAFLPCLIYGLEKVEAVEEHAWVKRHWQRWCWNGSSVTAPDGRC